MRARLPADTFHRLTLDFTLCNLIITSCILCDCKKTLIHFSVSPHPMHGVALILLSNIEWSILTVPVIIFAPLACRCRIAVRLQSSEVHTQETCLYECLRLACQSVRLYNR